MSTFVEVSSDRLLTTLREIGGKVSAKGGRYEEKTQGKEIVAEIALPPSPQRSEFILLKVYTSIAKGEESARGCGEDAIRIAVGSISGGEFKPVRDSILVKRTASNSVEDREGAFLARLTALLREAYAFGLGVPVCDQCGHHMAQRTNTAKGTKFWGCTSYPTCRGTKKI